MAKATRICKICGREYEYCHTNLRTTIFRWQDVACSPEHGAEYFAQVSASRRKTSLAANDSLLLADMDKMYVSSDDSNIE